MKKLTVIFIALALCSCTPWKRIADLTVMSSRNVDSKGDYKELARYVDSEQSNVPSTMKHADKSKSLEFALEKAIATVPGGEYMRNVTVYQKGSAYKIVGDVWGQGNAAPTVDQLQQQMEVSRDAMQDSLRAMRNAARDKKREEERLAKQQQEKELADKFKIGDHITWRYLGTYMTGDIIGKNDKQAAVKYIDKYGKEKISNVYYKEMTIIQK